jgi:thiamine-monophosphate kinase
MMEASNQFGVAIVGGNISSASKVMINITLMGILKTKNGLRRSAARFGDQIAITGNTGLSAAGLQMLRQNLKFDTEASSLFRKAHLKPVPRVNEGQILLRCGVRAAIDISDGLIADLSHICEASRVSATVSCDLVPIHSSLQTYFKDSCQHLALSGGEDYELLFTATGRVIEKVRKALSCPVTVVGEITEGMIGQVTLVNFAGDTIPLQQTGWEHFKSKA